MLCQISLSLPPPLLFLLLLPNSPTLTLRVHPCHPCPVPVPPYSLFRTSRGKMADKLFQPVSVSAPPPPLPFNVTLARALARHAARTASGIKHSSLLPAEGPLVTLLHGLRLRQAPGTHSGCPRRAPRRG